MKEDGGSAFPREASAFGMAEPGMSLRDYFAGQVLAAIWSNPSVSLDIENVESVPRFCYGVADEMLRIRKETRA